jgi:hypothetical protein
MSGERTSESTEDTDDVATEPSDEHYDDRAEEFLELEAALSNADGTVAAFGDTTTTGVVTHARRVKPASIPEAYPVKIGTTHALGLTVLLDTDTETTIYTEWPDRVTEDDPLVRLLARLDIHPSRFADIAGAEVPLERVDDRYVLDLPEPSVPTEHSSRWVWGIIAGLALWVVVWLATDFVGGGGRLSFLRGCCCRW